MQSLGSPGIDYIHWLMPVYLGDRLTSNAETLEMRRSRNKPEMGSVKRRRVFVRQNCEQATSMEGVGLFAAGSAEAGLRGATASPRLLLSLPE